ncbi:MAG: energy transducer TonB [Gemmatimonadetes bacterium]|nr:energy transducer TonB [Gemmatimonadota bacterium]
MSADREKGTTPPQATPAPASAVRVDRRPAFGGGLLASNPPRNKALGPAGILSTVLHLGLVGAVVYATIGNGIQTEEDEVTVVELTQEMAPPPPPPPPPVDQPQAQFQGFQTLSVPDIVPGEIPPPGEVAFKASDFTGQGIEGGVAGAKKDEGAVVAIGETPSFTPFTVAPNLKNRDDVGRALEREYPPLLRDAGVGGKVEVWVRISEKGAVEDVQIHQSSGHPALDAAAIKVGQVMQFSPAMNRDKQVPVWVSIPITFQVR